MADFTGKYKQTSSDNLEALLKHQGVPEDIITRVKTQTQELVITKTGNGYTIQTINPAHTREVKFELGAECTETFPNGQSMKSVFTADGDRLVRTQSGDKPMTTVYELTGSQLRVTSTSGPVVAVRTYAKQ